MEFTSMSNFFETHAPFVHKDPAAHLTQAEPLVPHDAEFGELTHVSPTQHPMQDDAHFFGGGFVLSIHFPF